MSFSEWKPVWDQAVAVYGHEPIEWRVGLALALAFFTLMIVEGLRANFLPVRKRETPAAKAPVPETLSQPPETPQTQAMPASFTAVGPQAPQAFSPLLRPPPLRNRKRETAAPRPQRSMRPKIRRLAAGEHGEQHGV